MGSHGHCECLTDAAQSEVKQTSAAVARLVPFVQKGTQVFNSALITCTSFLLAAGACPFMAPPPYFQQHGACII